LILNLLFLLSGEIRMLRIIVDELSEGSAGDGTVLLRDGWQGRTTSGGSQRQAVGDQLQRVEGKAVSVNLEKSSSINLEAMF
jgi:hypothetical protein